MGDTDNALQPTKKRAAGREISRDNPGLDDEEDSSEQETGTFKRASEEVLATRRIVKVRRGQQPSAPSSNPFSGIRLVPSSAFTVTKSEATMQTQATDEGTDLDDVDGKTKSSNGSEKAKEDDSKQSEEKNGAEVKGKVEVETQAESKAEEESAADEQVSVEKKSNTKAEEAKPVADIEASAEEDEKKDERTPLNSFQQLSSSQNAFTNLSGTGFSTSTFSFGSIKSDGSGFGTGSGSLFGLKTDQPPFGLALSNNGRSSLFGNSGSSITSKSEASSIQQLKEVEVETGEENEEAVFSADSVLYEFIGGAWKERGKGEIKINVSIPEKEKARLVMRAKGNYRLILNASIFPDMKLTAMEKKGLSFACVNSIGEEAGRFSTVGLKFRDPSMVEEFRAAVASHKGKAVTATVLKTPENSPKACDE